MLRAHRQAWCWQDEWTELSMADIRALEEETARMLAQRMAKCNTGSEGPEAQPPGKPNSEARVLYLGPLCLFEEFDYNSGGFLGM